MVFSAIMYPLEAKEMKLLKGQEVWLIPQTNSVRRGIPLKEQIITDVVEKCGNKMFYLKTNNGGYSFDDYCNTANYGWLPFKSNQDALDYLEIESFKWDIKSMDLTHLGIDEVRKIKKIIETKSQQNMQ
ncbi:hypothetical protein CP985_13585 [Malaciobacter mytili LMG 24559]|uniref:Uncharacterized protein n=2 Tax=Malaciobacter mytili TaxID=603050 RepID=A0AAX2AC28_9BACT|nr:hypothetical protein AMYT_a0158 [Malaciobacter mytili LMG 24559]RXK12982.1 hypothetical protein CP985_13585 [Malaciobacter mytili LMG 24559]